MARLFGTDGVRGVAGELLSAELALSLGQIATALAAATRPRVLVIRDTRESGEMLQAALSAGVSAAGGEALLGGVLPTPAAPLLLERYGLDLAVVISASHNPYQDNGLKFFGADGFKLSDQQELAIERALEDRSLGAKAEERGASLVSANSTPGGSGTSGGVSGTPGGSARARGDAIGRIRELHGTSEDYLRALESRFAELRLDGLDLLLDCANGATYEVAPKIFRRLGAEVTVLAAAPDGRNINDGCGSTHVESLGERVREGKHALGLAFDGDGDRVLALDRNGVVVDGDELIAISALHLRDQGRLGGGGVAVTVMTNYGFHLAMEQAGIEVACTDVGDRYVLEELRRRGWTLGGEQSGHLIEMGFNGTGDGIASALLMLEALAGGDLAERSSMRKLPQRLVNVPVADKQVAMGSERLAQAIDAEQQALSGRGRVLVRASGTESLVRVMAEAPTEQEADDVCARLVAIVQGR